MQTILGANGIIGRELSKFLPQYTTQIRQVSRHPQKVNPTDELFPADLLNYEQTELAVQGSDIVYLVAGLKYELKVWQVQWPRIMKNALDACKKHGSKLVFFDNVYAYGRVEGEMKEETPFNPVSKKGEVRAKIATMMLDEIKAGNLTGMIVRAADFYGPGAILSMTYSTVTERLKAGKGSQWVGNPKNIHTFTYTPDAGKSVALLANSPAAYNQTWHALTSAERITGEQYVKIACEIMNMPYKLQSLPTWGVKMIGVFNPLLRELSEMMYQFDTDYIFSSLKFEKAFSVQATSYREGIAETLKKPL